MIVKNNFCIWLYVTKNEEEFEKQVPLELHGQLRESWGLSNDVQIYVMAGANLLSEKYITSLRSLGYKVQDVEKQMSIVLKRFPAIASLPPYYSFTYLRWILAKYLIEQGELDFPYINIDADMVFMGNYEDIAYDVAGKTFLLQGCPCFAPISNFDWLVSYEKELLSYLGNQEAYHRDALLMSSKPICDDRIYGNVRAFKIPFRHEQDFQEYLISAGRLPQSTSLEIYSQSKYYWVQNPLFINDWFGEQSTRGALPVVVEQKACNLSVAGKALPFVHFQNDFSWYMHCWIRLHELNLGFLKRFIAHETHEGGQIFFGKCLSYILRRLDKKSIHFNRRDIYIRAFERNPITGNLFITDVLNSRW